MGRRCVVGNGSCSKAFARHFKWFAAERLSDRQSASSTRGKNDTADLGMAVRVLGRSSAGFVRALYSNESSGIASMEGEPRDDHSRCFAHRGARVEAVCVPGRLDDLYDVFFARYAGFVP